MLDKRYLIRYNSVYSDYTDKSELTFLVDWRSLMAKKIKDAGCCKGADKDLSSCKVESIISIDERGQLVLPKDIRDKVKIRAGDKLAVVSWEKNGEVCCISLMKVENLTGMVKDMLGPLMKEIIEK